MSKIIIIQDSPTINIMIKMRLEAEGFSVDIAETGEDGVKKVGENRYDLILTDLGLPGISGAEVCNILKGDDRSKDIPIVLISARDEEEIKKSVDELGAKGFITLPFEGKELVEKINGFLGP
ncbi:MAG: response regulator transcription factor [Thermodesulfobacteriota bacterium]